MLMGILMNLEIPTKRLIEIAEKIDTDNNGCVSVREVVDAVGDLIQEVKGR